MPASRLDLTYSALSHPVRRAILRTVRRKETRITELAKPFELSLNAISKHVRVLENARLVRRRRAWREHWVSFNAEPLDEAAAWIQKVRTFWNSQLDALENLLAQEDAAAAQTQDKRRSP
jgi:DNA-binding transcriptional ArsR family regulator